MVISVGVGKKMQAQINKSKKAIDAQKPIKMVNAHQDIEVDFNPNKTYKEIVYNREWEILRSYEYREYRANWDYIPRNKVETDFPMHLDIETTNICNLSCPMCPRTVLLAQESFSDLSSISKNEYKDIIDEGVKYGLKSIKLNYLGEPLSHKDLVWQIQYAKDKGVVDVMMNTNASLLTKKMSKNILNAGIDSVFVSFDAIDPEDYESQRVGTSIGLVIDNVYEFVKQRKKIRPSCQIRLSMVMYKDPKWLRQFEAIQVMWEKHVDAIGYGYYTDREENKIYPKVEGFHCAQPFQRMFLKVNGNVTICCVDDKDEVVVGNWKKESLHNIWSGEKYKKIRNMHANGQYYDMKMCQKCYLPHSD
jgi:radical SAM protein with 4Fe4S-binding SPASM domain